MFSKETKMQNEAVAGGAGLSQGERLIDTFVAPSKTFTDILRSTSWWLPLIVLFLGSLLFSYSIDKKVGFDAVAQQQLEKMPAQEAQVDAMAPADKARVIHQRAAGTKFTTYGFVVVILIIVAIHALLLWASFNFGLGAKTTFPQVFAVIMYAGLPKIFISLIGSILLFAGVGIDGFDVQNPAGTNIGYFLSGPALRAAGGFFDIFGLWSLALLIIGMAIISRKSTMQSAMIVIGWWVFGLLISVGMVAAFS
jgi:hypothetical protein